ncbi:MAG: DUF2283 domain-containing protein [Halobacteriales archaeon SW_9_67_25]|jgi:hypothetical protein|nr:MAG: DUF2283 domain-containing protein [Halobacteriales archaeon SW_9_67_25]
MGGLSVWYDEEGDYLELTRRNESGFFVDLGDGVFERVNEEGETVGVAVLNVSSRKERELPFDVTFEKRSEA